MTTSTLRLRSGLTLIEMTIALVLTLLIFGAAVPFFRVQARTVTQNAGRMDALQNARFALNAIDREVRIAGIGVVDKQPMIVQADRFAFTFNADLLTRDRDDPGAVYYDPDADIATTTNLSSTRRITLPRTSTLYPDSTYYASSSVTSRAETISYWVQLDSASGRSDQYVLYRRVNDAKPRIVTGGIIIPAGQPFFRYFRTDSVGRPDSVRTASLPLIHTASLHGAVEDTGRSALTDSIRVVRVRISGLYRNRRPDGTTEDVIRTVESSIKLLNAGMIQRTTCGDAPLGTPINANNQPGGAPRVSLTWSSSADQSGGEKDVERYALFKRRAADPDWGEPFLSFPANLVTYSYTDNAVAAGEQWQYGIMAQDCSPSNSALSVSAVITVNP